MMRKGLKLSRSHTVLGLGCDNVLEVESKPSYGAADKYLT